jgi:hypothetical protein
MSDATKEDNGPDNEILLIDSRPLDHSTDSERGTSSIVSDETEKIEYPGGDSGKYRPRDSFPFPEHS